MFETLELRRKLAFLRAIPDFCESQAVLLTALTICGAVLRLQYLGAKSLWVDEAFSAVIAAAPWREFWHQIQTAELNMLPYYLLLRLWLHFGSSEAWLRLLSALFGIATIPTIYLLASRLFNRRIGLLSAALLAVHPGHVSFSQEARSYSLAMLLVTVFAVLLLNALCYRRKVLWGACALAAAAAAYSHFFAVLACLGQVLGVGIRPVRQHLRTAIVPVLAFGLLIVPIGLFALNHDVGQLSGVTRPKLHHLMHVVFLLTGNGLRCVLYLLLWGIAGWQNIRANAGTQPSKCAVSSPYSFLLAWLLVPLLITAVLSFWKAAVLPRYLLVSLPAAVLMGAAGAVHLPSKPRAFIVALLMALSMNSVVSHYHRPKQDWRSAIQYVLSHCRPGDAIAIMPESSAVVYDYYGVLRNPHGPRLLRLTVGTPRPAPPDIWVVTASRPLKIRSESRKAQRWQEASTELEELFASLGPAYSVTEVHDSEGVRVLLLARAQYGESVNTTPSNEHSFSRRGPDVPLLMIMQSSRPS